MNRLVKVILICLIGPLSIVQVSAQDAARGKELYQTCMQCHGDQGQGVEEKAGPKLAGQFDWYILSQLELFKKKERHNPEMFPFISNLNDKDFKDLAAFIAGLKSGN